MWKDRMREQCPRLPYFAGSTALWPDLNEKAEDGQARVLCQSSQCGNNGLGFHHSSNQSNDSIIIELLD
jgi:hypothetical protein